MSETTGNDGSTTGERTAPLIESNGARTARAFESVDTLAGNGMTAGHERTAEGEPVSTLAGSGCEVLVAIPAYNEASTIGGVVERAREYADAVLVIDDGSDDDTADSAVTAGALVSEHGRNRGYGAALKTVFAVAQRADVAHLVVLDGDGQHDPADVPRLVDAQQDTAANLVIGSRFVGGVASNVPLYRRAGLKTINTLTNLSMGVVRTSSRVSDTQSGFRAYDREAIATLAADPAIGDWMSASIDILYHAHHYDYAIEEVAIEVSYDVENPSTHAPVSHGVALVRNILKTIERERPLTALAVPGFSLTFGGLGFGYWAATNYVQSGTFPFGLALMAVFLTLLGIFACFTAIVLHSLSTYFESAGREGTVR
ncbi:glycosyltransferase family 2 protein [Halococcus sp. AFM35]|uniref:glycosyltransferase family 2 protein n=1 Tax=Halococcus sp. AFM35 TaxID=3421653 RepID=UPI003EBED31C